MQKLSILSFNVFGSPHSLNKKRRMSEIGEAINTLSPDIVALQEVFFKKDREKITKGLINHKYFEIPKKHKFIFGGSGGLMFFSKFEIVEFYFEKYKEQGPITPIFSLTDRAVGKGFLHVKVAVDGEILNLINTHILGNYRDLERESVAQKKQIGQLVDYILKIPMKEKLIFCGDLNVNPQKEIYRDFIEKTKLFDPLDGNNDLSIHLKLRKFLFRIYRNMPERLDYTCFKNIENEKINQEIVFKGSEISDHMGIYSKFEL